MKELRLRSTISQWVVHTFQSHFTSIADSVDFGRTFWWEKNYCEQYANTRRRRERKGKRKKSTFHHQRWKWKSGENYIFLTNQFSSNYQPTKMFLKFANYTKSQLLRVRFFSPPLCYTIVKNPALRDFDRNLFEFLLIISVSRNKTRMLS